LLLVKRKHIEHEEEMFPLVSPKQKKTKKKKKKHTPGDYKVFVFLCASPKGLSG